MASGVVEENRACKMLLVWFPKLRGLGDMRILRAWKRKHEPSSVGDISDAGSQAQEGGGGGPCALPRFLSGPVVPPEPSSEGTTPHRDSGEEVGVLTAHRRPPPSDTAAGPHPRPVWRPYAPGMGAPRGGGAGTSFQGSLWPMGMRREVG